MDQYARFNMNMPYGMPSYVHSEVIAVPDRMVGLIIGKGGEQISSIQTESECRIQFAADSAGMPERQCTLTGTTESIRKARALMERVMNKGHDIMPNSHISGPPDGGSTMIEIMIPGNKAGIIIGKGGETIKQLQEQTGVRMVIIQETSQPSNHDKPLRITGDRICCQQAKEAVLRLLAEKDGQIGGGGGGGGGLGDYNPTQRTSLEIAVPRTMIGIVIGKGGEMIKKIQQESGARIQFRPDDEMGGPNRMCNLTGSPEQTQAASNMIQELIDNTNRQGRDGGWSQLQAGGDSNRYQKPDASKNETTYAVPAEKCGLVIGKGGDTIREICRQSGAHVELIRDQNLNSVERIFRIQGSPDQIQAAVQLICDKAGIIHSHDISSSSMVPGSSLTLANMNGQLSTHLQQQPQIQHLIQPGYAVQNWPTAGSQFQQFAQPSNVAVPDPNKQVADVNTAAWVAYYSQFYNQLAQPQQQPAILQPVAKQLSPYGGLSRAATTTLAPQPSINPQTGQLDYSAAWADYYRQQGMHHQAQAVLQATSGLQQLQ